MSLACRHRDRIIHDKVGLAGRQTKRWCLPEGQTIERGSTHTHRIATTHTKSKVESCEV